MVFRASYANGFFWQTLWEHPGNQGLRARRASPHVLEPGDAVVVPAPREKKVGCATAKVHTFRRRGVPEALVLRLLAAGEARVGVAWTLAVDGVEQSGVTDREGTVRARLMPDAREVTLTLRPDGAPEERHEIALREVDPVESVRGQQVRLRNLGFFEGAADGAAGDAMEAAVASFQRSQQIEPTGVADEATRSALLAAHGC